MPPPPPRLRLLHATCDERPRAALQRGTHHHPVHHLVVYHGGPASIVLEDAVLDVPLPGLVLVGPGVAHAFEPVRGEVPLYDEVTFRAEAADGRPLPLGWDALMARLWGAQTRLPAVTPLPRATASALRSLIAEVVDHGQAGRPAGCAVALDRLLGLLWQRVALPQLEADPLERVRLRLDDDGDEPDLAELSRLAQLSPSQLVRRFAARFGLPPRRWRLRRRLQRAAVLLHATPDPVATVAERCGFADRRYFARAFRTAYGCTPRAWRLRD